MFYRRKGVIQVWNCMRVSLMQELVFLKSYQSAYCKLMDYDWPQHYAHALKNNGDVQ